MGRLDRSADELVDVTPRIDGTGRASAKATDPELLESMEQTEWIGRSVRLADVEGVNEIHPA